MKRKITATLLLLLVASVAMMAKTTYVPTYFTKINVKGSGIEFADSTNQRDYIYSPQDERYSLTILHDSVTKERVKSIKRMKAAAGWATASAILSGASAALNPMNTTWDAVHYMNSVGTMASSTFLHYAAAESASQLEKVPVIVLFQNNTDKEMTISDMNRGLTWYVPAYSYIELKVGNPEVNKFRIANAECVDQKIDYATIQSVNMLDKKTIEFEDETCWVYRVYGDLVSQTSFERPILYYEKLNKVTFERENVTWDDIKALKKAAAEKENEKKQHKS